MTPLRRVHDEMTMETLACGPVTTARVALAPALIGLWLRALVAGR